jgi:long-chain acyl-CoA synthetase
MASKKLHPGPDDHAVFAEVLRIAELHPQSVALVAGGAEISYARLVDLAWRDAERLVRREIGPGTRVVLVSQNRPEWLRAYLAISAAGARTVPLAEDAGAEELTDALGRARVVIGPAAFLARLGEELAGAVCLEVESVCAPHGGDRRAAA